MYAAWISQLNTTYTMLNITGNNTASTIQPGGYVYNGTDDGGEYSHGVCRSKECSLISFSVVNGTMHVALTSSNPYVTPYNLSLLNDYIIAFGQYQAD